MYALTVGPYGAVFALSWNRDAAGQLTTVVRLDTEQGKLPLTLKYIRPDQAMLRPVLFQHGNRCHCQGV